MNSIRRFQILVFASLIAGAGFVSRVARAGEFDSKSANACIVELCGPSRSTVEMIEIKQREFLKSATLKSWMIKHVEPRLEKLISKKTELLIQRRKSLSTLLGKLRTSQLTAQEHAFVLAGVLSTISSLEAFGDVVSTDDAGYWQIDGKKLDQLLTPLSGPGKLIVYKTFQTLFKTTDAVVVNDVDSNSSFQLFKQLLTPIFGRVPSEKDVAGYLVTDSELIASQVGSLPIPLRQQKLIKSVAESGVLPAEKTKQFIKAFEQIVSRANILKVGVAIESELGRLSSSDIDKILNLAGELNTQFTPDLDGKERAEIKSGFRISIRTLLASAPTPKQEQTAKLMIEKLLAASAQQVDSFVSLDPEKMKQLRDRVLQLKFDFPRDRDEMSREIISMLEVDISESEANLSALRAALSGESHWPAALAAAIGTLNLDSNHLSQSFEENIDNYNAAPIVDSNYPDGVNRVSWQSVQFPEYSSGIIAHEIGHAVSRLLGPLLSPVMMCTASGHKALDPAYSEISLKHAKEDWADVFSTSVINKLGGMKRGFKNMACLLQPRSKDANGYADPSLEALQNDPHSSGLYRLIKVQAAMGKLPMSCLNIIPQDARTAVFRTCERSSERSAGTAR